MYKYMEGVHIYIFCRATRICVHNLKCEGRKKGQKPMLWNIRWMGKLQWKPSIYVSVIVTVAQMKCVFSPEILIMGSFKNTKSTRMFQWNSFISCPVAHGHWIEVSIANSLTDNLIRLGTVMQPSIEFKNHLLRWIAENVYTLFMRSWLLLLCVPKKCGRFEICFFFLFPRECQQSIILATRQAIGMDCSATCYLVYVN